MYKIRKSQQKVNLTFINNIHKELQDSQTNKLRLLKFASMRIWHIIQLSDKALDQI